MVRRDALLLLALAACGSRAEGELAGLVDRHCRGIEAGLRLDAGEGEAPPALFRGFLFCAEARRVDRGGGELTRISVEFQIASQEARGRDGPRRQAARRKMLELFERVNRLPIKR